ncbi:MAG TPA: hypothetical protein ENH87_03570 [Pricia antarctica]|uniref:AAA domain-containing protein n=1 Tax=Pricia antarctica TaxID=641691 RepID=A0A831QKQ2_9FLAO|nr:hypothetical protein [Pricia antarctica]
MKAIFYITGKQGTGKTALVQQLRDSVEINMGLINLSVVRMVDTGYDFENIAITTQVFDQELHDEIKATAKKNEFYFFSINF